MLKIEHTEVLGWGHAIRGMRNPMNSWEKSDSEWVFYDADPHSFDISTLVSKYQVGPNDLDLMTRLRNAGTDHRKFMRMIVVYCDITAPLYWWKEFDTYKVGTVANSCSTMHKIAAKEFTLEDFSCEHLMGIPEYEESSCWEDDFPEFEEKDGELLFWTPIDILRHTIGGLNFYRQRYLDTKDKKYWWQMIQLLPSSYNQRRTVMLNYEVLANIYKSRRNHKLDEWKIHASPDEHAFRNRDFSSGMWGFCDWIESLPYSELITGPSLKDVLISNEIMEEAKRRVHAELNAQWDKFYEMHGGHENDERAVFRIRKEDVDPETWDTLMKATQEGKSFHIFEEDKSSENCSDGACDIKW